MNMEKIGNTKRFKARQNIILKGFDPISSGGFTQVPNSVLTQPGLSVGAKLTYSMLLRYAWQNDFCFPGQQRLADDMGASRRSVVTYLKELKKNGLLETKRLGLGKTNRYILHCVVKSNPRS